MATRIDITQDNDADFYQTFGYSQTDGQTPISVSGAVFKMSIRRNAQDQGVVLTIGSADTTPGVITILDGPNGRFAILLRQATLVTLAVGSYVYSVLATLPAAGAAPSVRKKVFSGSLTIQPGPSR